MPHSKISLPTYGPHNTLYIPSIKIIIMYNYVFIFVLFRISLSPQFYLGRKYVYLFYLVFQ